MTVNMRWEQCCESTGCTKPARHGSLCAACLMAATPARRAVELLADRCEAEDASERRHMDFDAFYARLEQEREREDIAAAITEALAEDVDDGPDLAEADALLILCEQILSLTDDPERRAA
jgi:membrane-bound lytic murein transglycosylase B